MEKWKLEIIEDPHIGQFFNENFNKDEFIYNLLKNYN